LRNIKFKFCRLDNVKMEDAYKAAPDQELSITFDYNFFPFVYKLHTWKFLGMSIMEYINFLYSENQDHEPVIMALTSFFHCLFLPLEEFSS